MTRIQFNTRLITYFPQASSFPLVVRQSVKVIVVSLVVVIYSVIGIHVVVVRIGIISVGIVGGGGIIIIIITGIIINR